MNRCKIISSLYLDADLNKAIKKMQPVELQEDLKQEIFLVICEMSNEKFFDIYEKGYLKFFAVRTMLNMAKSDRSNFFTMFRKQFDEIHENLDRKEDEYCEEIDLKLKISFEPLYWYEKEIFRLYSDNGKNIKKLSRDTGIPYRSLFETIKKVRASLKIKIRNYDFD